MVGSILLKGKSAFLSSDIAITIDLGPDNVNINNINETRFDALMKKSLRQTFPDVKSRKEKKKLYGLLSADMGFELRDQILNNTSLLVNFGLRTANPIPMAPPQSCTTNVISFKSRKSTSFSRLSIWVVRV